MTRLVEPRLKKVPKGGESFRYFEVFCGLPLPIGDNTCGLPLGRIEVIDWPADEELLAPENAQYGDRPVLEEPSVGSYDLLFGVTENDLAKAYVTTFGAQFSVNGETHHSANSEKWNRVWVAVHERGYNRRDDDAFGILQARSPVRESWRTANNGRSAGSTRMPRDMADWMRARIGAPDGSYHGLAPGGKGIVGARPILPAVVICPKCGLGNKINPLALDEGSGIWYTVRIE